MRSAVITSLLFFVFHISGLGQATGDKFAPLIKKAKKTNSNAVIVLQDGKKVVDYQKNTNPEKIYSRSVTKSVIALAIAKLLSDGKIDSLATPVSHYYTAWKQGLKKNITIRHLMNHSSGLQNVDRPQAEIYPSPDAVQLALCASVVDTPGTKISYNNKATNLLSGIVEKITGQKLDDYLESTLFQKMAITNYDWQTDEAGNPYAMSGFKVIPSDLAKLGQLVLQNGAWDGQQLISEKWMDKILAQGSPKRINYGLLWWRIPKKKSYIVDNQQLGVLKEAGLSDQMLAKARQLNGSYDSKGAVVQQIMGQFSSKQQMMDFRQATLGQGLELWRSELSGPIIGYKAEGSLGEYLVIYPKQNIVAVRMIRRTNDYNQRTDNFGKFSNMVYQLATSE